MSIIPILACLSMIPAPRCIHTTYSQRMLHGFAFLALMFVRHGLQRCARLNGVWDDTYELALTSPAGACITGREASSKMADGEASGLIASNQLISKNAVSSFSQSIAGHSGGCNR